ncbi:MAG TPA: tetratricopeptide repeat protein [Steroidobacteraceae bacterium]|jgi:tetratricopeptide (TPR) repeat protein|nr:tetratricopeptide repeat protein [Steroidobacteraceae bacterium]
MKLWNCNLAVGRLLAGAFSAAAVLLALPAAVQAARGTHDTEDSNALIMTAEIALQRDDCGRAAANYTIAAQRLPDAKLAARAADVALDCGQFQAAERAAARWRALVPGEPAAMHAAMRAELGLYKIDDARGAFEDWIKNGGLANARGSGKDDTGAAGVAEAVRLLAQEAGVSATLAMLRGVQDRALQSGASQLALADLALDGWNYREAVQYGEKALSGGAAAAPTQLLLARAHAGLGESEQAVAAATAAHNAAPKEQGFASADVLMLLGRERDARTALEALRDNSALHMQAQRRLGLLAFNRGDYEEAQHDFSELLNDHDSSAVAVYYLAAIADRRNDVGTALRGYQLLGGTALDGAARDRAATLLYKQGQRDQALRLLQPGNDASPAARLTSEIEQAQLLSNGGEADQSLARIADALARFPAHPDLLYQKAILLEKAGRTDAAVTQLESLYRDRPQDGAIANALGFLLADHNRELSRAERLIAVALKSEPDNPAILDSMGWLDYRRGNSREALPLLERAFRLAQDGDIGAHWGEVLWSVGDKAKAREAWSRALISDPDNALVRAAQQRAGVPQMPASGTGTSI